MKKFFQILFIPIFILFLCADVCAETVYTEDTLNYIIRDDEVIITNYFGMEEEVTIPHFINNMPVTIIATGAFVDTYAKRVYLPDSIAYIEPGAFSSNVVYSGINEEEKEPENPGENEEDYRIDNNSGAIESIPSIEIKEGSEEGEVDIDGNVVVGNNDSNINNQTGTKQINNPVTIEKTYVVSPALYVAIGVGVIAIITFIIVKKKLKNDRN